MTNNLWLGTNGWDAATNSVWVVTNFAPAHGINPADTFGHKLSHKQHLIRWNFLTPAP